MYRHHEPFSRYIGPNLWEYLGETTLQLRSWGSDVEVSAAATLHHHLHILHRDYLRVAVVQAAVSTGWKEKKT